VHSIFKLFAHVNAKYIVTVDFFLEWLQMNPECLHGQVLRLQMPHFDAMYSIVPVLETEDQGLHMSVDLLSEVLLDVHTM